MELHQPWLYGFDTAWMKWQSLEPAKRSALRAAVAYASSIIEANVTDAVDPLVAEVQLLNAAGRHDGDPWQFIEQLVLAQPGPRRGDSAVGTPEYASEVVTLAFAAPDWELIADAWATLTPRFRDIFAKATAAAGPLPQTMVTPADYAWLDRAFKLRPIVAEENLLRAYRDVPAGFSEPWAMALLDQYESWMDIAVIPKSGCRQSLDRKVPILLAQLASFHAPLNADILRRIKQLDITYPAGIFQPEMPPIPPMSVAERAAYAGCLLDGFALVSPTSDANLTSSPIKAGYVELLEVRKGKHPLLVVMDVDLARPEMQILGLQGKRLRICDWASSRGEGICFTRVGFDGSVHMRRSQESPQPDVGFRKPEMLVIGRALISTNEGLREAGYLGASERIGGAPNWEQEGRAIRSPADGSPMVFLAQFPHPLGGTAYVFLDYSNLIAAVMKQWD